jgi:glycosyltransferase involved in cell wall biosynthesis
VRVLHLHAGKLFGGTEVVLETFARNSAAADLQHVFGLCFPGPLHQRLQAAGGEIRDLGPARLSRPWSVAASRRTLRRIIREDRPDVAIAHGTQPYALFRGVLRRCDVPVALYLHTSPHELGLADRLARIVGPPDRMIGVSRYALQCAQELLFSSPPTAVVHNPLPFEPGESALPDDERAAIRRTLTTSATDVVVIQATRMIELKGHGVLLEALARLRDLDGWTHWLVGGAQSADEAAYEAALQSQAERLGIAERVRFLGQRDDVPALMAAADIYCQANVEPEGLGIAFVEALASGLPVITSDIGPAREIVTDRVGTLVAANDHAALAEALRRLILDRPMRRRLSSGARDHISGLMDAPQQVRRLAAELELTAGGRRPAAAATNVSA